MITQAAWQGFTSKECVDSHLSYRMRAHLQETEAERRRLEDLKHERDVLLKTRSNVSTSWQQHAARFRFEAVCGACSAEQLKTNAASAAVWACSPACQLRHLLTASVLTGATSPAGQPLRRHRRRTPRRGRSTWCGWLRTRARTWRTRSTGACGHVGSKDTEGRLLAGSHLSVFPV